MNFLVKIYQFVPVVILIISLSSCAVESFFPSKVANGAARLTIKNLGNLPRALNDDALYAMPASDKRAECDFRTFSINDKTQVESDGNGKGKIIREFQNCVFDFGNKGFLVESNVKNGCSKTTTTFLGKVSISGKRTISGILTQNAEYPVIPSGENSLEMHFSKVEFQNYRVESSSSKEAMTIATGSVSYDLSVHLGKEESSKLCKIPLPNITLKNIRYSPSKDSAETLLTLSGPLGEFSVPINESNLQAQVGMHAGVTNKIEGTIKVWNDLVHIPKDDSELDPNFSVAQYETDIGQCTPDLLLPVSNVCSFEPELGSHLSRLTVYNLGNIVRALQDFSPNHKDESCRLDGIHRTPGMWVDESTKREKGQALVKWDFEKCEYDFGKEGTLIGGNLFSGKITVSGQKRVLGLLTGDKNTVVVPGESGVEFDFSEILFENYEVSLGTGLDSSMGSDGLDAGMSGMSASMRMISGRAKFKVAVHLEKSGDLQIHQDPLSKLNLTFENISFLEPTPLALTVTSSDLNGTFYFSAQNSQIHAQVGESNGKKNTLEGFITMFGETIALPGDGFGLIPWFPTLKHSRNAEKGDTSYELVENLVADGLARLTVNNLGNLLLAATDENQTRGKKAECNFVSVAKTDKTKVLGDGKYKTVTWRFDDCEFDFGEQGFKIAPEKTFYGKVRLSGEKSIHGHYIGEDHLMVIPTNEGVSFKIDVAFDKYFYTTDDFDKSLVMNSGKVHFDALVHLGRDKTTDLCIEPVQNLTLSNIIYSPSTVEIRGNFAKGLLTRFRTSIHSSQFSAQVGYGETEDKDNRMSGVLNLFGRDIPIPTDGLGLDPSEDHREFFEKSLRKQTQLATLDRNSMFVCRTFDEVEALTMARLMILNVGGIAQESFDEYLKPKERNWDEFGWDLHHASQYFTKCGFNSNWAKLKSQIPYSGGTSGKPGSKGTVELNINSCEVINLGTSVGQYPMDCLKTKTMFEGKATVSGKQIVHGIRLPFYEKFGYEFLSDISPNHPESTSLHLTDIRPTNFTSYFIDDGEFAPKAKLTLLSGQFSADLFPVLAAKKGFPCEFYRATPVVGFQVNVSKNIPVRLDFHIKGITFSRYGTINSADYSAHNGFYKGIGNFLKGRVKVNGVNYQFDNELLNPFYEQVIFDRSYSCRETFPRESEFSIEKIIVPYEGWIPDCENATPHGINEPDTKS